jgi:SAM-dependent methyltransferase
MDPIKPSETYNYYRGEIYWNNFEVVAAHLNRLVSGSEGSDWIRHTHQNYSVCNKGLFLNCGNGWVERNCYCAGLVRGVIGTDISESLLTVARSEAVALGMPAEYIIADVNNFCFDKIDFDWIFNHAAFHHICRLDFVLRQLWARMPSNGYLVCYDYTGPHRNQYPWEMWSKMVEYNETLPKRFQATLRYPHLPTMIATDPTEAIHSELILEVCRRYFDFLEIQAMGGGIAYQILFKNYGLFNERHNQEGKAVLEQIVQADMDYTAGKPERSLFNYWVGVPKAENAIAKGQLQQWSIEEDEREALAVRNGMRYQNVNALEIIYNLIDSNQAG